MLAWISQTRQCIGAANLRNSFCSNDLSMIRGEPRCQQSVGRSCLNFKRLIGARWWRLRRREHHLERRGAAAGAGGPWPGLVRRFAGCFTDRRDPRYVEHQVETLVGQRIFGLALGYEDLNDHDELRKDPTLAVLAGKLEPVRRSDCEALAGKSTLNRLEHTPRRMARSITRSIATARRWMRCWSISSSRRMSVRRARSCSISITPTSRCTACRRAASFTVITRITAICRSMCSAAGTCCWRGSDERMSPAAPARSKCSAHRRADPPEMAAGAHHPARRQRLCQRRADGVVRGEPRRLRVRPGAQFAAWRPRWRRQLAAAKRCMCASGQPARVFRDFRIARWTAGAATRRVVGKAEHKLDGANPRFVVTSLKRTPPPMMRAPLRGSLLRARRGREPHRRAIRAVRRSRIVGHHAANQLRMWFSALAYVLRRYLASRRPAPHPVRRRRRRHHSPESCSSSAPRCASACAASTSPSPRAAPTRPSSPRLCQPPARLQLRLINRPVDSTGVTFQHIDARPDGLALRVIDGRHTRVPRTSSGRQSAGAHTPPDRLLPAAFTMRIRRRMRHPG